MLISQQFLNHYGQSHRVIFSLSPSLIKLCTFSGRPLSVVGEAHVDIEYGGQSLTESIVVVKDEEKNP